MNTDIEEKRKKAEAGSTVAQTVLGISYRYGLAVDVDYKEAFRFLSAAANQGASRAVLNLGIMHAKGFYEPQMPPNCPKALQLLPRAELLREDFAESPLELGRMYSSGISVNAAEALRGDCLEGGHLLLTRISCTLLSYEKHYPQCR